MKFGDTEVNEGLDWASWSWEDFLFVLWRQSGKRQRDPGRGRQSVGCGYS